MSKNDSSIVSSIVPLFYVGALVPSTFIINGVYFGLPAVLTGKRVSLCLLTLLALSIPRGKLELTREVRLSLGAISFVVCYAFFSSIANGRFSLSDSTEVFAWILNGLFVLVNAAILPRIVTQHRKSFVVIMLYGSLLILIAACAFIVFRSGLTPTGGLSLNSLRNDMQEALFGGLNRFLNSLFFWLVFPVAGAFGLLECSTVTKAISRVGVAGFLLAATICGSRQNVVAGAILVLFVAVWPYFVSRKAFSGGFNHLLGVFASFVVFAFVAWFFLSSDETVDTLNGRLIGDSTEQLEEGEGRIPLFLQAMDVIKARPLFGVGGDFMNHELNVLGKSTHNGYSNLATAWGIPPLIVILLLISVCIARYYRMLKIVTVRQSAGVAIALFCFQLVYFGWLMNFNTLLKDTTPFLAIILCSYWLRTEVYYSRSERLLSNTCLL